MIAFQPCHPFENKKNYEETLLTCADAAGKNSVYVKMNDGCDVQREALKETDKKYILAAIVGTSAGFGFDVDDERKEEVWANQSVNALCAVQCNNNKQHTIITVWQSTWTTIKKSGNYLRKMNDDKLQS